MGRCNDKRHPHSSSFLLSQHLFFTIRPSHTTSTYHVVLCTVHFHSLSYFQLVYQQGVFACSLGSMSRCIPKRTPVPHVTILPVTRSQSLHPALYHHPT